MKRISELGQNLQDDNETEDWLEHGGWWDGEDRLISLYLSALELELDLRGSQLEKFSRTKVHGRDGPD